MDRQLTVKLSVADAELIMKVLVRLPYEQVAQLIMSFDQQIRPQLEDTK